MEKKALLKSAMLGITAGVITTGCAVVDTVDSGRSIYQGYQAYQMAGDVRDAEPVFEGATHFQIDGDMLPSDDDDREQVEDAFMANLDHAVEKTLADIDLDIQACYTNCPSDSTVVIQYREQGRDGFVERFTMGDKIGGDLYFVRDGHVIDEVDLDMAEDYASMTSSVQSVVATRAARTQGEKLEAAHEAGEITESEYEETMQEYVDRINEIDLAVKEEYEATLSQR